VFRFLDLRIAAPGNSSQPASDAHHFAHYFCVHSIAEPPQFGHARETRTKNQRAVLQGAEPAEVAAVAFRKM